MFQPLVPVTRRSQLQPRPMHGLGSSSSLTSMAKQFAGEQVRGVTMRSQLTPDLTLTGSEATGGRRPPSGGFSDLWWKITKPAIYVETTMGTVRIAPWGEPSVNLFPVLVIGTVAAGALVAGLIARGLRQDA